MRESYTWGNSSLVPRWPGLPWASQRRRLCSAGTSARNPLAMSPSQHGAVAGRLPRPWPVTRRASRSKWHGGIAERAVFKHGELRSQPCWWSPPPSTAPGVCSPIISLLPDGRKDKWSSRKVNEELKMGESSPGGELCARGSATAHVSSPRRRQGGAEGPCSLPTHPIPSYPALVYGPSWGQAWPEPTLLLGKDPVSLEGRGWAACGQRVQDPPPFLLHPGARTPAGSPGAARRLLVPGSLQRTTFLTIQLVS